MKWKMMSTGAGGSELRDRQTRETFAEAGSGGGAGGVATGGCEED